MAISAVATIEIGSAHFVTKDGYECVLAHDHWRLSRTDQINWADFRKSASVEFVETFKLLLSNIATVASGSHVKSQYFRMHHFCKWSARNGNIVAKIHPTWLANYRADLPKRNEWYVAVIAGTIRKWAERGYPGLGDGLLAMLDGWTFRGNVKGEAVRLQSITDGALTDLEFEALHSAVASGFERGEVPLEDFVLVMLLAFSGRRPVQLADLKTTDLITAQSSDGLVEYVLNVPRRKQRGGGFRSNFKPYALNNDNGLAIAALTAEQEARLAEINEQASDPVPYSDLPLFPDWAKLQAVAALPLSDRASLPPDVFHLTGDVVRIRLERVVQVQRPISERTADVLNVYPTRLRRTTGTRAAREGYGPLLIAELLDHSDTQNVNVYVENIPEHVDAINKAVAAQLAPIAQAFAGTLVDLEGDAVRGGDPSSRVRVRTGEAAGTCGHHGFCGAFAPIACYTCINFQPWLHGPHEEVLEHLLADQDRVLKVTSDRQVSTVTDRTIIAVTRVIQLCVARKIELGFL